VIEDLWTKCIFRDLESLECWEFSYCPYNSTLVRGVKTKDCNAAYGTGDCEVITPPGGYERPFRGTEDPISSRQSNEEGANTSQNLPPTLSTTKVEIDWKGNNTLNTKVYPNPFKQEINIEILKSVSNNYRIYITDVLGKTVWKEEISLDGEEKYITINTDNYAAGLYQLIIADDLGNSVAHKIIRE